MKSDIRKKSIFLLPSIFTIASLFFGFFAVVQAMGGNFELAVLAVWGATVFDGIDGRVARLTHTESAFGAELDSLSDMVSFGVAPALVVYEWALSGLGKVGWLTSFVFCMAAALRLARFNVRLIGEDTDDKAFFQGLPSPAAAVFLMSFVFCFDFLGWESSIDTAYVTAGLTLAASLSMVSSFRYWSGKQIYFRMRLSFSTLVFLVLAVAVLIQFAHHLPLLLLLLTGGYLLSGYVISAVLWSRRKKCP